MEPAGGGLQMQPRPEAGFWLLAWTVAAAVKVVNSGYGVKLSVLWQRVQRCPRASERRLHFRSGKLPLLVPVTHKMGRDAIVLP